MGRRRCLGAVGMGLLMVIGSPIFFVVPQINTIFERLNFFDYEAELETWNNDIPLAGRAGKLWRWR